MPAYWEMAADRLAKQGWSHGIKRGLSRDGRRVCVADAHRDDGPRHLAPARRDLGRPGPRRPLPVPDLGPGLPGVPGQGQGSVGLGGQGPALGPGRCGSGEARTGS